MQLAGCEGRWQAEQRRDVQIADDDTSANVAPHWGARIAVIRAIKGWSVLGCRPGRFRVRMTTMRPLTATGMLHGSTIELDTPVPPLEGRRVRVLLESVDPTEAELSEENQAQLWQDWASRGPQGPIDEDAEVDFP